MVTMTLSNVNPGTINHTGALAVETSDSDQLGRIDADHEVLKGKLTRQSYTREKKIEILQFYNNNQNTYKTCKKYGMNSKSLSEWICDEQKICTSRKGTMCLGPGRKPFWPDMETELKCQFEELHAKGIKVKHWWFKNKVKQLVAAEVDFKFSAGYFDAFKCHQSISYRSSTNVSHQTMKHESENFTRVFDLWSLVGRARGPLESMSSTQLLMLTRLHCHSLSVQAKGMQRKAPKQCGSVVMPLAWKNGNVLYS